MTIFNTVKSGILTRYTATSTIADNGTVGSAVEIPMGMLPVKVRFPAGWTSQNVTFQVSDDDGSTYTVLYDPGDAATDSAAYIINSAILSTSVPLNRELFRGNSHLKPVSAVAQTGGDILTFIFEKDE